MIHFDTVNKPTLLLRARNYVNLSAAPNDHETCLQLDSSPFSAYHPSTSVGADLSLLSEEAQSDDGEAYHYVDYEQAGEPDHDCAPVVEPRRGQDAAVAAATGAQDEPSHHDDRQKVALLRQLLANERSRNQRRAANNAAMQDYLARLQNEYLDLQRELVQALELARRIGEQKAAQIESINELVREKENTIERLRESLDRLDENNLRREFELTIEKQKQLFQLQQQQLHDQINALEAQLTLEQAKCSALKTVHQKQLDELGAKHTEEVNKLSKTCQQVQADYERVLEEPSNVVIKSLRDEKCLLENQVDELSSQLLQNQLKCDSTRRKLEDLLSEFETIKKESQDEIEKSLERCAEQRQIVGELRMELEDKNEVIQIVQFNLNRSEKRVKNLLSALKSKESAYDELISNLQVKHEQELDTLEAEKKTLERKSIDLESEVSKKQNEIVRLELEHANQIESIKNDRDQRVHKLALEKQKLERDLQSIDMKLANEIQARDEQNGLIEKLQKDLAQFKEASKRLSIEVTKTEARLFSKQQEIKELHDKYASSQQNLGPDESHLVLELEAERRRSKRFEETVDELRRDCDKLNQKLKFSEFNLSKLSANVNKEHTKLVAEYEKKLEHIRAYQCAYDKSRLKYRKYGYKLRKYCEHLRRAHQHLCNPSLCGYMVVTSDNSDLLEKGKLALPSSLVEL